MLRRKGRVPCRTAKKTDADMGASTLKRQTSVKRTMHKKTPFSSATEENDFAKKQMCATERQGQN